MWTTKRKPQIGHDLSDADIETALDQINIDATCSVDSESSISNVPNKLVETNDAIEVVIEQTDQIIGEGVTGKW